ncbi:nuclear transport factor 2-like isoform X2 [Bidens hawaiensis]|uniref:nuclear transport factor 2-like isoform X2 n=1 Tax=Bidens hawaiensis TaxID=980011 RepID=UPI004048F095
MASLYSSSVTASQVGSYFVEQYYSMLQQQPEFAYQFYTDSSSMILVDGESTQTASAIYHIHTLLQSLHFSGIEIGTINSSESWSGGIIVVVSGAVKSNCFLGSRKFVQTFFLAPQEKGYFVINDIFHFVSDEVTNHFSPPLATVHKHDFKPLNSSQNLSVAEDAFEVEKFNSLHLQSNGQGDYFTSQDRQNHQQEDYDGREDYEEESTVKQSSFDHVNHFQESFYQNTVKYDQQPLHQNTSVYVQEPTQAVEKPVKFTYASILKSNAKSTSSVPTQAPVIKRVPSTTGLHQPPEPETTPHVTEDALVNEEGESMSVYVRNLPTSITTQEIYQEFKNFGRIKQDGVFIKNRKDVGVCFAFVEFEDISGVHKAIEASPIQLAGKQVYVEERRANSSSSSSSSRGGSGKGRGSNDATRGRYGDASNGRGNGLRNH